MKNFQQKFKKKDIVNILMYTPPHGFKNYNLLIFRQRWFYHSVRFDKCPVSLCSLHRHQLSYVREFLDLCRLVSCNMSYPGGGLHKSVPWSPPFRLTLFCPSPSVISNVFFSSVPTLEWGSCEAAMEGLYCNLSCSMRHPQDSDIKPQSSDSL